MPRSLSFHMNFTIDSGLAPEVAVSFSSKTPEAVLMYNALPTRTLAETSTDDLFRAIRGSIVNKMAEAIQEFRDEAEDRYVVKNAG